MLTIACRFPGTTCRRIASTWLGAMLLATAACGWSPQAWSELSLNDKGYFEAPGLDVIVFSDIYPEGHQTGVTVVQHGTRVAANGDLRLEASPGQWSPVPVAGERVVDQKSQRITQTLSYPDPERDRTGFNPIVYPDLAFSYDVHVRPLDGNAFRITVDLDTPLPDEWVGKVGFNVELSPAICSARPGSWTAKVAIFPRSRTVPWRTCMVNS